MQRHIIQILIHLCFDSIEQPSPPVLYDTPSLPANLCAYTYNKSKKYDTQHTYMDDLHCLCIWTAILHCVCQYAHAKTHTYKHTHTWTHKHTHTLEQKFESKYESRCTCMRSLHHTALHCNTLQHTATHCNTLYAHAVEFKCDTRSVSASKIHVYPTTLYHTAPHSPHCNTLQHTATHPMGASASKICVYRLCFERGTLNQRAVFCARTVVSVLQCVAVCRSVLQRVAACCSVCCSA